LNEELFFNLLISFDCYPDSNDLINKPTEIWMCELHRQDTRFTALNTAYSTGAYLKRIPAWAGLLAASNCAHCLMGI